MDRSTCAHCAPLAQAASPAPSAGASGERPVESRSTQILTEYSNGLGFSFFLSPLIHQPEGVFWGLVFRVKPYTLDPKPKTLNPKPKTENPKPLRPLSNP